MLKPWLYQSEAPLLHEGHDRVNDGRVLLVRGKVADDVGRRDEFVVGSDLEAVFRGVLVARALFGDGFLAQGVAHVEARVAEVEALVEALGAAAHDDDLLALEGGRTFGEFGTLHKSAGAE